MIRLFIKSFLLVSLMLWMGCQNSSPERTERSPSGDELFTLIPSTYSNLDFQNPLKQTHDHNHMIDVEFISGGGVALGDINGDGMDDIFFTANQRSDKLYLNQGGLKFKDISSSAGITQDQQWSRGVTFVDIDQDGDQDIYVCRSVYLEDEKSANQLYINNGDLTFTESAASYGLADRGFSVQAAFCDFNKDGKVDMYLVNQPPSLPGQGGQLSKETLKGDLFSDRLYVNQGDGTFKDQAELAGLDNFGFGLNVSIGDFDNDTWMDIYVTNDFDVPDHMYMNQKDGTFKDVILESTKHISNFSMGSDIADIDNDGLLDIIVVDMMAEDHKRIKTHMSSMKPSEFWRIVNQGGHYQYMFNTLQRNNGNGSFSDVAQLAGVSSTDWSWAPLLVDFDNDGYKDLFVTNGVKYNNRNSDLTALYEEKLDSIRQIASKMGRNPNDMIDVTTFMELAPVDKLQNYIFKNNGDLTFKKVNREWGFELPTLSNGAAYADLDGDGDLDLVVNDIDSDALLYRNNSDGKANYVRFQLESSDNNSLAGTSVKIYKDQEIWQLNQLSKSRGYQSASENIIHFGLGAMDTIEKVEVVWNDGTTSLIENVKVNTLHTIVKENSSPTQIAGTINSHLFADHTQKLGLLKTEHKENEYDDYTKEVLLPHKMSQLGPFITVGDVNGDQLEDFFLGGASGSATTLMLQKRNGTFATSQQIVFNNDKLNEDMDLELIDIDGDSDLDLYVVSGGNEFDIGENALLDRIYKNDGNGNFEKCASCLPEVKSSGSCVTPMDYDGDGDIDLFVGGRLIPGQYPQAADSYLLQNNGGTYTDVTDQLASDMRSLGLVTSSIWLDYNDDSMMDLAVVGEWMPLTFFTQGKDGTFTKVVHPDFKEKEGWYYEVAADDMDGDGDVDLVLGNLGKNYKYKASSNEPFEVYSSDLDKNGKLDIVLSYHEHGKVYPVRGKECSSQQMPSLKEKFTTYESFGSSDLIDVYGSSIKKAYNLKARTFASMYVENKGDGSFALSELPSLAQISSVNGILTNDFDKDGHKDILAVGNLFTSEIETPRNDASIGLFMKGDGKGGFTAVPYSESGFSTPHDAKSIVQINVGAKKVLLVGNNDSGIQAINLNGE